MKSAVFKKTPNQHPTAVVLLLPSNHRLGRLRQGESCVKRSVVWSIRLRPEGTAVLHGIWNSRLISFGFFISTAKAELFIFSTETFFILLSLYLNACKFCDVANEGDPVITQIVHEHLAPTGGIMSNELSNCFQIFDMGMTRYDLSINKMCMLEEPNACSFAATLGGLYYVY